MNIIRCRVPPVFAKHRVVLRRVPIQNIDTMKYIVRQCVPLGYRPSRILNIKPDIDTITIAVCPDLSDANEICRCFIENGIEATVISADNP